MTNATSIIIADKAQMANSPVYGRISFFQQPCSFLFAACTTCVDEARLESLMTEPSSLLSSSTGQNPAKKGPSSALRAHTKTPKRRFTVENDKDV